MRSKQDHILGSSLNTCITITTNWIRAISLGMSWASLIKFMTILVTVLQNFYKLHLSALDFLTSWEMNQGLI